MIIHKTTIELAAEPSHEGTNDIVAGIIDKLGELTHGCALITKCDMTIEWITGGTYCTHLTKANVHDIAMDPQDDRRRGELHQLIYELVDNYISFRGDNRITRHDLEQVLSEWRWRIWDIESKYNQGVMEPRELDVNGFNYLAMGLDCNYRIKPIEGSSDYEIIDITQEKK